MNFNLFNYSDYKVYLAEKITHQAREDRSFRSRLSEHVQCQPSYLSQVLNGKPDFTLEQAHRLNHFFLHDKVEARFFILLVEKSRAGTRELKQFFNEQIEDARKARFDLKKRLKETEEIAEKDQHKYYSAWFYSAIYVILSIPHFQSIELIANRFNLPEELVAEVVSFLEGCGLIENKNGKYHVTKKRLHLERESTFIQRHHINWRSQALQSAEKNLPGDMHFSTVVALSKADYEKIKEVFVKAIHSAREIIRPSEEEEIMAITLDVFKL
jgi:uncharacterized protein (TIGR02147 family)